MHTLSQDILDKKQGHISWIMRLVNEQCHLYREQSWILSLLSD